MSAAVGRIIIIIIMFIWTCISFLKVLATQILHPLLLGLSVELSPTHSCQSPNTPLKPYHIGRVSLHVRGGTYSLARWDLRCFLDPSLCLVVFFKVL